MSYIDFEKVDFFKRITYNVTFTDGTTEQHSFVSIDASNDAIFREAQITFKKEIFRVEKFCVENLIDTKNHIY